MKKQNLLNPDDLDKLRVAVNLLESPTLTAQMTNAIATLSDYVIPKNAAMDKVKAKIIGISEDALNAVFWTANKTMENKKQESSPWFHKLATATTGAVGGFFGLSAILVELPISTTIMMRSILDIARAEGFSIDDPQTKIECITVFGLEGNLSNSDDNSESGYYMARVNLGLITKHALEAAAKAIAAKKVADVAVNAAESSIADAAVEVTEKALGDIIIQLIQKIAEKFGVTLSETAAAKSIPVLGAIAGASLNVIFTDFYQDMAKGHFAVKKLEKKYSEDIIKDAYLEIYTEMKSPRLNKK